MRQEHVKALPVVDSEGQVLGMVSTADFVRQANMETPEGMVQKLRNLVTGRGVNKSKVQELMDADAPVVQVDCMLVDLIPCFLQELPPSAGCGCAAQAGWYRYPD